MTTHLIVDRSETVSSVLGNGAGPVLALRSWLIAPERQPGNRSLPMLTGLYGYPWRTDQLDARCTAGGRAWTFTLPPRTESYHPVVPELECSCGVYAVRDESIRPVSLRSPVGVPVVSGFVELSGRILAGRSIYRAQRASIVGPLSIQPGRPPAIARLLRRPMQPRRVAVVGNAYLVRWATGPSGQSWSDWVEATARALRSRYQVKVIVAEPDADR